MSGLELQTLQRELRIVLVGKTGVGKSATGNTILGERLFKKSQYCDKNEGEWQGIHLTVVDTPCLKEKDIVKRCLNLFTLGPHVFLLVVKLHDETPPGDKYILQHFLEIFGENVVDYTMVLLTHRDKVSDGEDVLKHVSQPIREFIQKCQDRYHVFDNTNSDRGQVTELLKKMEKMEYDSKYYSPKAAKGDLQSQKRKLVDRYKTIIKIVAYLIIAVPIVGSGVKDAMTCACQ